MIHAACSSAFDGMHPTLRHTPPRVGYRSTSTVRSPRSAARNAAVYPPGPAPSTTTSVSMSAGTIFPGAGTNAGAASEPAMSPSSSSASVIAGGEPAGICAASGARVTSAAPSDTVSPTATRTDATVPACGEGTSIVALSLSRVTRGVSTSTRSPGETSTSMTGTSPKSPMSGTGMVSVSVMLGVLGSPADMRSPGAGLLLAAGPRTARRHRYSNSRRTSPSRRARCARKRAASAPSTTR